MGCGRRLRWVVVVGLALASCADADSIGIHLRVAGDGTAQVTCRSLQLVTTAGPFETGSDGVEWQERAQLFASRGRVPRIEGLRLQDLTIARTGETALRVQCPRGPDAKWHALLAPPLDGRKVAAGALDPVRPSAPMGETILIEIEAPGPVTAVGHAPQARLVKSDKDGKRALLWIPTATAREGGEPIVFDLTWR